MEGLDQVRQPVVIETDFAEYTDEDGMTVLHFKAMYTPVRYRDVTFARKVEMDYVPFVVHPMTFLKRLKFLVTGKV
jgi:hypothetical protein